MSVDPLKHFAVNPHPLGHEIVIDWELPDTLPINWNILFFKRKGSNVQDSEIDTYVSTGVLPDDVDLFDSIPKDLQQIYDLDVLNGSVYYYKAIILDTDTSERSNALGDSATSAYSDQVKIEVVDCKWLVIEAVRRVFRNRNVDPEKDVDIRKSFSLVNAKPPIIAITRQPGSILQEYFGHLVSMDSNTVRYGQVEIDNIMVLWECIHEERRDYFTNLFRIARPEIRAYLYDHGVKEVHMSIGGDSFDPRWEEGYLATNSMLISCTIEPTVETENMQPDADKVTFRRVIT